MNSFIVTIIESANHIMHLQCIKCADSEGHLLSLLNVEYPQYHLYEVGATPRFRCYITFLRSN